MGSVAAHIGGAGRQGQAEPRLPTEGSGGGVWAGTAASSQGPRPHRALLGGSERKSTPGCRCYTSGAPVRGGPSCSLRKRTLLFPRWRPAAPCVRITCAKAPGRRAAAAKHQLANAVGRTGVSLERTPRPCFLEHAVLGRTRPGEGVCSVALWAHLLGPQCLVAEQLAVLWPKPDQSD